MSWNREQIRQAKRASDGHGLTDHTSALIDRINRLAGAASEQQLQAFYLIVNLLRNASWLQDLSEKNVLELETAAYNILRVNKIEPERSSLDFMYSDFLLAKANWQFAQGLYAESYFTVASLRQWSKYLTDEQKLQQSELFAKLLLRQGEYQHLRDRVQIASFHSDNNLSLLLLMGDADQFHRQIAFSHNPHTEWWLAVADCFQSNLLPLVALLKPTRNQRTAYRLLHARLWAMALRRSDFVERFPKVDWIKRNYSQECKSDASLRVMQQATQRLEAAADQSLPLARRISELADLLPLIARMPTFIDELLALAVACRLCFRARQYALCQFYLDHYVARSRRISNGRSQDALQVASDILHQDLTARMFKDSQQPLAEPVQGKYQRRLALLSLFASGVKSWTGSILQSSLANKDRRSLIQAKLYEELARKLVDRLDHLKGAAMKLGQLIAFMHPYLSRSVQEELHSIMDAGTAMAATTVDEIFVQALGQPPKNIFAEWNEQAIAAASIGQVHLAVDQHGRELAVKVQYPGVADTIVSDLDSFLIMQPLLRQLFPQVDLKGIIAEVRERFIEECDYDRERAQQRFFGQLFAAEPDIVVPAICEPTQASHIIATEFVHGLKYRDIAGQVTQDEANHYGKLLFKFFIQSLVRGRVVYCDPNPGNFLFADGKLVVLDFGLIKQVDEDFVTQIKNLYLTAAHNDSSLFRTIIDNLGLSAKAKDYDYQEHFNMFLNTTAAPWKKDREYTFDEEFLRKEIELNLMVNPIGRNVTVPPELFLIMRGYIGFSSLLSGLNARANWHRLFATELGLGRPEILSEKWTKSV